MDADILAEVHSMRRTRERRAASEHERLRSMAIFVLSTVSAARSLHEILRRHEDWGIEPTGDSKESCLELERLINAQYRALIGREFGS